METEHWRKQHSVVICVSGRAHGTAFLPRGPTPLTACVLSLRDRKACPTLHLILWKARRLRVLRVPSLAGATPCLIIKVWRCCRSCWCLRAGWLGRGAWEPWEGTALPHGDLRSPGTVALLLGVARCAGVPGTRSSGGIRGAGGGEQR